MPPEVSEHAGMTVKNANVVDIHATGVILYTLLTSGYQLPLKPKLESTSSEPGLIDLLKKMVNKDYKKRITLGDIEQYEPGLIGLLRKMTNTDYKTRITLGGIEYDDWYASAIATRT